MTESIVCDTPGNELATVDWSKTAREIHNQVRARRFGIYDPPGPVAELDGRRISLLRTSLRPAEGLRKHCGDGPLWITEYREMDVAHPSLSGAGGGR